MSRIAVIFESSPFDRKGLFNAVHNRVKYLVQVSGFQVDVYCMQVRENFLVRMLRGVKKTPKKEVVTIDGIRYRMLWRRFSILDWIRMRLNLKPTGFTSYIESEASILKTYDLVLAHSYEGGYMALQAFRSYSVPYVVTWHGSDIHTHPFKSTFRLSLTRRIMDSARINFFVSESLMAESAKISENAPKAILYNGVSEDFVKFSPEERREVRSKYNIAENDKVVAYVGNFYTVKNVTVLPELFSYIHDDFESHLSGEAFPDMGNLKFWAIGDGRLRKEVESYCRRSIGFNIDFKGNLPAEIMPEIMNCIDVLVLPSRNEGLPLVTLEAISCGANVVGADVGGIAEVAGKNNTVPYEVSVDGMLDYSDPCMLIRMAQIVVKHLLYPRPQSLNEDFDWKRTAEKEFAYIEKLLSERQGEAL